MLGGEDAVSDPNAEIPDPSTDQMLSYYSRSLFFTAAYPSADSPTSNPSAPIPR